MYCVIYSFKIKNDKENDFTESWKGLTNLIYEHEGSLGSRLHKLNESEFIAYAQWPSQNIFDSAGDNLPTEANTYREQMKNSCTSIETIYKMEMIEDLLKDKIFNNGQ